jgi:biopolymer transport protein ExbD
MAHIESQGSGGKASQDFELNLAPIIDCMVVLIAFLMVSLSYLSVQILDAGLTSPGGLESSKTDALSLEIKIVSEEQIQLEVSHKGKVTQKTQFKLSDLEIQVGQVIPTLPSKPETALINANNDVSYDLVIRTLDSVKNHVPQVQLSGF